MNFKKYLLPVIIMILVYGFWISPEFKEISAGVAIFLFGMKFLEQGFKAFTGGTLEKVLQKSTDRTWKSLLFGFTSATVMQSSSLVSLLTISFISVELITLLQGIGIIFGANIGTTTGAWLIAAFGMKINISVYAMPMLVFGILFSFQKSKGLKGLGSILAGLGFLFLGIHYMKEGFEAVQNNIQLIDYAMEGFLGILTFAGIGILATIVMQSSHATIILVIAALATGQVTYENALALIIGANIGTTITAILGALTSNINGKRLAMSDVLFKVTTGVIFIIFLPFISDFVTILGSLIGIAADNYTLKLALFHTLFNVLGLVIVIPFMGKLIQVVMKIFPDTKDIDTDSALYLSTSMLDFPNIALLSIIKETKHLYNQSIELILEGYGLTLDEVVNNKNTAELVAKIKIMPVEDIEKRYQNKIKKLYAEILDFISHAQAVNDKKYNHNFYKLKEINIKIIENIKVLETSQVNLAKYTKSTNENIKEEYNNIIIEIIDIIRDIHELSTIANDPDKLICISKMEIEIEKDQKKVNKKIDKLIRNQLVSSYMGSSLINDIYSKNEVFDNFFEISKTVFNNKISEEVSELSNQKGKDSDAWFGNIFGLTDKKIDKAIKKLKHKNNQLKKDLNSEKDSAEIKKIKSEIKIIEYTLDKYNS